MPWGRLDDGLYDHPKIDSLGRSKLPAVGLFVLSISWSNRRLTDGFVPADRVIRLGGSRALAETLADAGLFDRVDGGYRIHDFLTFNDSAVTVQARRDAAAERQRRHRDVTASVTRDIERDITRDNDVSHKTPARARARQRAGVPARPIPVLVTTPQPPTSGGRRANGTTQRQLAAAAQAQVDDQVKAKRWRANQRELAYHRGSITDEQRVDMQQRDASLEEIPDQAAHMGSLTDDWLGTEL